MSRCGLRGFISGMDALGKLRELASAAGYTRPHEGRGKAVGFLCSHVPEEILIAAGITPVRLRAPGCTQTTSADAYMSHLNCTYVRSCLEYVLTSRFDFLDGFVLTNGCDHSRRLYDILRETSERPFMHLLSVPRKTGAEAASWFTGEIARFRESVEKALGVEITDEALRGAIDTCNETRSLLRQMYEMRKQEAPPISGADALAVVVAGWSIPRHEYNDLLRRLVEELGASGGITGRRARLMVAGSGGCDDPAYLGIFEDLGGLVVTDSLCFGSRSFWQPVAAGDDPLMELARATLERPHCASMANRVAERSDFVVQMARQWKADGVVFQWIRYCDLWGGQLLHLRPALEEAGIPLLTVEREYALGGAGQLRTRAQAFLERIER